ncbi:MAG: hypothetical protein COC01_01480 [Bacteroidetes bacterium]|nr:MAG: hypothetical protein COC01_01480 [Bacteroidota bacterium]
MPISLRVFSIDKLSLSLYNFLIFRIIKLKIMKKVILPMIAIIVSFNVLAGSGGPDTFGYTWVDSNDPNGPTYSWIDITPFGKKIFGLGDDNVVGPFSVANNFLYYWYTLSEFYVGSNGYVSFGNINIASPFPSIPDSLDGKHNFVAGMMCDLNFTGSGNPGECFYVNLGDSLIVSWIDVPFWDQAAGYTGANSFQIIFRAQDRSITINYKDQTGLTQNNDITVGIENVSGNIGLQHSKDTYPISGYSIKYEYPANPSLLVTDGSANWNGNKRNGAIFLPYPSDSISLTTNIANLGNQDISPFTVTGFVRNSSGNIVVNSSINTLDTMTPGQDTTITFPNGFTSPAAGTYSYVTEVSGIANDASASNDSTIQEIISVDTSFANISLSYTDNMNESEISWAGGSGGIGVYFEPPYYPSKIVNTTFLISNNLSNSTFYAKIYDDDGFNGSPGTLLDSVFVDAGQINIGVKTTVQTANPVTVYNGGFYVMWDMNGPDIALAYDMTPPFSFRCYEVFNNIWAEYRDIESTDFFITAGIEKAIIDDIGVPQAGSPANGSTITAPVPVACWIKNYGQAAASNFMINYQMEGSTVVSESYAGTAIQPGDSAYFTFATQLAVNTDTTGNLCIWSEMLNDFDNSNDTTCITVTIDAPNVSVNELEAGNWKLEVFPNPSDGKFELRILNNEFKNGKVTVYNVLGEKIFQSALNNNQSTIDLKSHPKGTYILHLLVGDKAHIRKIITL